jgi:hypothetical protein
VLKKRQVGEDVPVLCGHTLNVCPVRCQLPPNAPLSAWQSSAKEVTK